MKTREEALNYGLSFPNTYMLFYGLMKRMAVCI